MSSSVESEKPFEAPEGGRPWYVHDGDWWLEIIVIIIAGLFLEAYLEKNDYLLVLRYKGYDAVQSVMHLSPRDSVQTTVLLVDDADYWKTDEGFPAGRSPISRPYLARLVTEVARFHPTVIALDFDLRAEHTDPQKAQGPAAEGICQLAAAIHKVTADPAHLKVVLAKSLWKETTGYTLGADVYDDLTSASCSQTNAQPTSVVSRDPTAAGLSAQTPGPLPADWNAGVSEGFIALPHQTWRMPYPVRATNRNGESLRLDPFSLAIAKAANQAKPINNTGRVPFAPYRDLSEWVGKGKSTLVNDSPFDPAQNICQIGSPGCRTVLASFFHNPKNNVSSLFANRIVLIGGDWHTRAYGQGERADRYLTPAGNIPGVLIHAGYVEGFRTSALRAPTHFGENVIRFADFWVSLGFALLLASFENYPRHVRLERFAISAAKICTVLLFLLLAFVAGAIAARKAYFFDFTVVAIVVVAHYAYDSVEWPWRKEEMDRDYTLLVLRWMKARLLHAASWIRSTRKPQPAGRVRAASSSAQEHPTGQVRSGEPSTDSARQELKTGTK